MIWFVEVKIGKVWEPLRGHCHQTRSGARAMAREYHCMRPSAQYRVRPYVRLEKP